MKKEKKINVKQQMRRVLSEMFLDADKPKDKKAILAWASDWTQDSEVQHYLDAYKEAARADKQAVLRELLEYLKYNCAGDIYGIDTKTIFTVHLYGGGPAGGVEFVAEGDRGNYAPISARFWHQEWYQPKMYADIPEDVTKTLWDTYGMEYYNG